MKEIKVAENKTLKLTNVLSREIHPEEMASLPVVLTQMHNFTNFFKQVFSCENCRSLSSKESKKFKFS